MLRPATIGGEIIGNLHTYIDDLLANMNNPFHTAEIRETGNTYKLIDKAAERHLVGRFDDLSDTYGEDIEIVGEERLDVYDTSDSDVAVLFDTIDGTDLLERNLGNWCTSIIVFNTNSNNILGAYVGLSDGDTFFTIDEDIASRSDHLHARGKYSFRKDEIIDSFENNINKNVDLSESSICMYGQKFSKIEVLRSYTSTRKSQEWIEKNSSNARFYNLAGNPMMVKMVEGDIDIVFELDGQHPHDVAPGAYIAKNFGATCVDLDGNTIESEMIANPEQPSLSYVLASNEELAHSFLDVFVYPNRQI